MITYTCNRMHGWRLMVGVLDAVAAEDLSQHEAEEAAFERKVHDAVVVAVVVVVVVAVVVVCR